MSQESAPNLKKFNEKGLVFTPVCPRLKKQTKQGYDEGDNDEHHHLDQ